MLENNVNKLWAMGNTQMAKQNSEQALKMRNYGICIGVVGFLLYIVWLVLLPIMSTSSSSSHGYGYGHG